MKDTLNLPRMLSPRNKRKTGANSADVVSREMTSLKEKLELWFSRTKYWNHLEWTLNAGRYADVEAVRKFIFDDDLFHLYTGEEEYRELRDDLCDDDTLSGKFYRKLWVSGADDVFKRIMFAAEMGSSWKARSMDGNAIAEIVGIDPDGEDGQA